MSCAARAIHAPDIPPPCGPDTRRGGQGGDNAPMQNTSETAPLHPFATLTPDVVLDALASVGLYGDGRLMALIVLREPRLPSHLEDGSAVVAKFYRPDRWSEAQILEEHAFAAELMAAEVPAVGPAGAGGRARCTTLAASAFSVSPCRGGRAAGAGRLRRAGVDRPLSGAHPHRGRRTALCRTTSAGPAAALAPSPRDWLLAHDDGAAGRAVRLEQRLPRCS